MMGHVGLCCVLEELIRAVEDRRANEGSERTPAFPIEWCEVL